MYTSVCRKATTGHAPRLATGESCEGAQRPTREHRTYAHAASLLTESLSMETDADHCHARKVVAYGIYLSTYTFTTYTTYLSTSTRKEQNIVNRER